MIILVEVIMAECVWCNKKMSLWEGVGYTFGSLCNECSELREKAKDGDKNAVEQLGEYELTITDNVARQALVELCVKAAGEVEKKRIEKDKEERRKKEEQEQIEKELQHVNYAKSFNEFYEYNVVTIINENHGTVDKEKMMKILSDHAKSGWKLHTMYSNELGKNALSILGFGVNATACEDVMIFERRIPNLD